MFNEFVTVCDSLISFSRSSEDKMLPNDKLGVFNFHPQVAKPRAAVTRVALSFTEMLLGLPGFLALS